MKKIVILMFTAAAVCFASCDGKDDKINDVTISLTSGGQPVALEGVEVSLKSAANSAVFSALTDASGAATFALKAGSYEASTETVYNEASIYNGAAVSFSVLDGADNAFNLDLVEVEYRQGVVIKEVYFGGCTDDAGKAYTAKDSYFILYNNSPVEVDASNYAFGYIFPYNSNGTSKWRDTSGNLTYTDYMPVGTSCWWFQTEVKIPAYSQIVVSCYGAINHTETVSTSVDLSNADYAMYEPTVFANSKYTVSDNIPASHYLTTYNYSLGSMNAWALSVSSPAFVMFSPEGTTAKEFTTNADNIEYNGTANGAAKIPLSWIEDAVEIYDGTKLDASQKRVLPAADAGYVISPANKLGYTIYRNVDQAATEALPENEGLLVYNYAGGTADIDNGSTDPSGIDAEASIANGAHIVYKDTNNSTNDFHVRKVASIKK